MTTVKDLFEVNYGVNLELQNCEIVDDNDNDCVNFVARTSQNNGVVAKVKKISGIVPQAAGTISCAAGGSVLSTFVQTMPYYSGRDLYVLTPKRDMNLNEKLFYAMCIKLNSYKYNYGRQANKTLKDIIVPDEVPKWVENYNIDFGVLNTSKKIPIVSETKFEKYNIEDVFSLEIGNSEDLYTLEFGNTKFVGRTSQNNGIQALVKSSKINKGGCITIGMVGTYFPAWQEDDFACSQNILILRNKNLNKYNALFLNTIIKECIKNKYSYNRPIQKNKFAMETIMLPANKFGNIDWEYMEKYIKSLPYSDKI